MTLQPHEIPHDFIERTQVITGLRKLADFLAAHPEVPVPSYGWTVSSFPTRRISDEEQRAEIDRLAAILQPCGGKRIDETSMGGHDRAEITFGRVTYEMVHIPKRWRDLHEAQLSYRDNVTLD